MDKIGIFGGSFNPVHLGHTNAVTNAYEQLGLDMVYAVVSNIPPHKQLENAPEAQSRLEMARLAFEDLPYVQVSDIELRRGQVSYTVDTIARIKQLHPQAQIYLIVGYDMFKTLDKWKDAARIFADAVIGVIYREKDENADGIKADYETRFGAQIAYINAQIVQVSSTEIRDRLKAGQQPKLLQDNVYNYIKERKLYE